MASSAFNSIEFVCWCSVGRCLVIIQMISYQVKPPKRVLMHTNRWFEGLLHKKASKTVTMLNRVSHLEL